MSYLHTVRAKPGMNPVRKQGSTGGDTRPSLRGVPPLSLNANAVRDNDQGELEGPGP